jgi:glycosyltransferase involved in cell wall biosynthesis
MIQKKSNIAVFSLAYSPFEGGAEIAAREIMSRLKEFNFTVFAYKFDRKWLPQEQRNNVEIIRLGRGRSSGRYYNRIWNKIFYIFKAWQKAEELHEQKRFEVIWAIMASYGGIAALFFKLKHPRIPLLLTIQEGDSEKHLIFGKFGLVGFLGKKIIQNADYIQVISNYLKRFAEKRKAKCPIEIIPNGVDINLFGTRYTSLEVKAVRDNLGIQDDYVIVTVSRLVYKNGIDVLIDAIAKFKEKRPNIKCLIIGDGPELKKLKAQSSKLKVDNNVIFLGQIPQRDLPLYLAISDIFVRPSRSEGLGNSFLEAMAAGVPVIGTPVGGIRDFLQDRQTGFYANVDDSADLAEKMKNILENSELRKKVVYNAKALIKENYFWDKIANLFKNIFDKLINL